MELNRLPMASGDGEPGQPGCQRDRRKPGLYRKAYVLPHYGRAHEDPPPQLRAEATRNLYDLLRTLIHKVNWADEQEKLDYLDFVDYAQQLRAFGDRLEIRKDPRT